MDIFIMPFAHWPHTQLWPKLLTTSIFFFGLVSLLIGQHNWQPYFHHFSTNDGLPSSEVHDILQDKEGYLWIATDNGVSRFDGYRFKNFGAKQGLENNVVFHLQEDQQGRVWMQTLSGNLYYYQQDSIYAYRFNDTITKYKSYYVLPNDIIVQKNGTVYNSLYGIGILKIDSTGKHEFLNTSTNIAISVFRSPEQQRNLFSISYTRSREFLGTPYPHTGNSEAVVLYEDQSVDSINIPDTKGGNLLSYSYADEEVILFEVSQNRMQYLTDKFIDYINFPAQVAELTRIDSVFWIGLNDKMGVRRYNSKEDILNENYQLFLPGKSISAICPDRNGGYWFGSLNEGIFYAPNLDLKTFREEGPSVRNNAQALTPGPDKLLLYGTVNGDIYSLDHQGATSLIHEGMGTIFDLWYHAEKDKLWIAGSKLFIADGSHISLPQYEANIRLRNPAFYKRIFPYPTGNLVIGNSGFGLEMLNLEKEKIFFTKVKWPDPERIICTYIDFDEQIWVGNISGLYQFKDSSFVAPTLQHPSFNLRVEDIDQLTDSTLVFGTKGRGIALWKKDQVTIIDESNGLASNMVENIYIDGRQQIWVGTLNGLNKVSHIPGKDGWKVERITLSHGLPSDEINDICQIGEWVYIATAGGIAQLPLVDTTKAQAADVKLEVALVNGYPTKTQELEQLSPGQKNIQLQYVYINFRLGGKINYRYRVDPGQDWSITQERSVNYAALAPGHYTFEVQAQNEDGIWGESLRVPIHIASPIWQRWWFYVLLGIMSFTLLYYYYRRRFDRLRKEAAIDREINELKRSALQAQMNPHFIFNCLNSIQNFIASGDKQNAMQYLSRFATLVRTTLNASAQNTITLEEELQVVENYLELEKLRFGNKFEYEVKVDAGIDSFDTCIPPLLVQPFIENALRHAFNFSDPKKVGHISISYEQDNHRLRITVRDNGIGIHQAQQAKLEQEQLHTSLGMSITQKRLQALQQRSDATYLQVTEVMNNGTVDGTEIIIWIEV